jgi:hypothetical protein
MIDHWLMHILPLWFIKIIINIYLIILILTIILLSFIIIIYNHLNNSLQVFL